MTGFRRRCLAQEGFGRLDDAQLPRPDLPLRFTPRLCFGLTAIGTASRNPIVFGLLAPLAATGAITRRHPFDFVREDLVRPAVGGPHLPTAPWPRRFAFTTATAVLTAATLSLALGEAALALSLAALQAVGCAAYVFAGWCAASLVHQKLLRPPAAHQAAAV